MRAGRFLESCRLISTSIASVYYDTGIDCFRPRPVARIPWLNGRNRLIAEGHCRLLGGTSLQDNCALKIASKDYGSIKIQPLPPLPSHSQIDSDRSQHPPNN